MRAFWLSALCFAAACFEPERVVYPEVNELEESVALPDPFTTFFEQARIDSAPAWREVRRPELIALFTYYVYGRSPLPAPVSVEVEAEATLGENVRYRGLKLSLGAQAPAIHLALFLPVGVERAPVFLALNPCGNQSLIDDAQVLESASWMARSCPDVRGGRSERWPIEEIVRRGYGLATFHESDVDPDDPADERFEDGVHPHFDSGFGLRTRWARLAAWSWGLSRAVDALSEEPSVNAQRIIAVGHSRRGKSALWAAALDERIAMAIPHQSGIGGASPSREAAGETVAFINQAFPHWFNDRFPEFGDQVARLPVDQHLLLALIAPRPLLVTNGAEDSRADPSGALRMVRAAAPVYELLGSEGVVEDAMATPTLEGPLSWHVREGGHSFLAEDWTTFMDFADLH